MATVKFEGVDVLDTLGQIMELHTLHYHAVPGDFKEYIRRLKKDSVRSQIKDQIGRELAMKLTKGNNAFIVRTHIDKHHVHNHVIINSTTLDCQRKFRNFWGSTWAIRRMNDKLCLEHGLSIVENPKPSRDHYGTWLGEQKQPSHQEQLRWPIDAALAEKLTYQYNGIGMYPYYLVGKMMEIRIVPAE